jgi:hypothetical protein
MTPLRNIQDGYTSVRTHLSSTSQFVSEAKVEATQSKHVSTVCADRPRDEDEA